jgi:hypothetical protein
MRLTNRELELSDVTPPRTQHVEGTAHVATSYAVPGPGVDPMLAAEHARHLLPWARQRVIGGIPDTETQLKEKRRAAARAARNAELLEHAA